MSSNPKVSIIYPVYNAEKYLVESIITALYQTFTDFELIAINDGSTDSSLKILREFANQDNRIRIIDQKNTGLVEVLNRGIREARGEYIARMDSDDMNTLYRLEKQVAALDKNADAVLVCGAFEVVDDASDYIYKELPLPVSNDLKMSMLLYNPIAHGSVMLRKSALDMNNLYSSECGPTEDFEFWIRLADKGDFIALPETMYRWRVNPLGITTTKNKIQVEWTKKHLANYWKKMPPPNFGVLQIRNHARFYYSEFPLHGAHYKNIFMKDQVRIGLKLIKRGDFSSGIKRIIGVMLVGRSGVKVIFSHSSHIAGNIVTRVLP